MKNFLDIQDFSKSEILRLLNNAMQDKSLSSKQNILRDKNLILLFEKKSTRTRLSFDIAIKQLGGSTTILNKEDIHLGNGKESLSDTISTLGLYADGLILRVNDHQTIVNASKILNVPIINALSNISHPCQCLAGLMTLLEEKNNIENMNIVWMGPITNVANSWIEAFNKELFSSLNIFCPESWYQKYNNKMQKYNYKFDMNGLVHYRVDEKILSEADVVMTDTWQSMGENTNSRDYDLIKEFRVTEDIMKLTKTDSIFMHCLPANRNEEVEGSVIDGKKSRVWQEAHNRLFVQKQILREIF